MNRWKFTATLCLLGFLVSAVLIFVDSRALSSGIKFLWLFTSLIIFAAWNYFPLIFERELDKPRIRSRAAIVLPIAIILLAFAASDRPDKFVAQKVWIILPLLLYFWLSCLSLFGKSFFRLLFYKLVKDPFSFLFLHRKVENINRRNFVRKKRKKVYRK